MQNKVILSTDSLDVDIVSSKIGFVQIFQNLLSNSIKFCDKPKVEIDINFSEDEEKYHIIFCDNGPGIDKKHWNKVFDMFETLKNTHNQNTGIGLATVKAIIERLGGEILIQNRVDEKVGACFKFSTLIRKPTASL